MGLTRIQLEGINIIVRFPMGPSSPNAKTEHYRKSHRISRHNK
ncbi:hypothetical protein rpr22_0752 [Rickettsia prowazekii str. Rp22]|uniref:Uncharacterized protein n=1 Tax=Rickettsia prowazekii (strain Rp22) TaxID=449216 RepID=D5AXX5_RICPP|nr:hypothetical protein rpr22_0752 [Rickettsia prowazekii str. Rp22]AGJ01630.1 hypothetical protein H374_3420 [Rickettsia prowazekii str. NMRC Madrid E]AGJ03044.1 hypothetical protein H375_8190 [Rickettsia prowazekii str. Breinl]EOB09269.1 hypothetical protein H376_9540 [Rickettsia prowazekii str. GvF12]EOB11004.1 hypothetical protein H377_1360 [Rickettsia prowazekii str. Cairo 3]